MRSTRHGSMSVRDDNDYGLRGRVCHYIHRDKVRFIYYSSVDEGIDLLRCEFDPTGLIETATPGDLLNRGYVQIVFLLRSPLPGQGHLVLESLIDERNFDQSELLENLVMRSFPGLLKVCLVDRDGREDVLASQVALKKVWFDLAAGLSDVIPEGVSQPEWFELVKQPLNLVEVPTE